MRRHTSHYASESCPEDVHHCSGPECTRPTSKDSKPRASDPMLLCVKGESGVATVEAARRHAH